MWDRMTRYQGLLNEATWIWFNGDHVNLVTINSGLCNILRDNFSYRKKRSIAFLDQHTFDSLLHIRSFTSIRLVFLFKYIWSTAEYSFKFTINILRNRSTCALFWSTPVGTFLKVNKTFTQSFTTRCQNHKFLFFTLLQKCNTDSFQYIYIFF